MSDLTPAPHFLPLTGDPLTDAPVIIINERLAERLALGETDVAFYMGLVKTLLINLARSPGMELAGVMDPMIGAFLEGLSLAGPALEQTLVNRKLTDQIPCDCPNCSGEGCDDETTDA